MWLDWWFLQKMQPFNHLLKIPLSDCFAQKIRLSSLCFDWSEWWYKSDCIVILNKCILWLQMEEFVTGKWLCLVSCYTMQSAPYWLRSWLITRLTRVHGRYIEPDGFLQTKQGKWGDHLANSVDLNTTAMLDFFRHREWGTTPLRLRIVARSPRKLFGYMAAIFVRSKYQEIPGGWKELECWKHGGTPKRIAYDEYKKTLKWMIWGSPQLWNIVQTLSCWLSQRSIWQAAKPRFTKSWTSSSTFFWTLISEKKSYSYGHNYYP